MSTLRSYGDGCAIAHGLDLVGERWALLVVRELLLGPKRYSDLRRGLPNASPNVLSQRLRELEAAGIVRRRELPPPGAARVYELTESGHGLEPIVVGLGHWGAHAGDGPGDAPIGADSVMLALRSRIDAHAAGELRASWAVRLGADRFVIRLDDGAIEVVRGAGDDADATVDTDPDTLAAVLWGGRSLRDAIRSDALRVAGEASLVERLVALVAAPAPAEPR